MLQRLSSTLAILGILAALAFYFYSASLYSAATSLDPIHGGYHHAGNYWCDLLDPVTYTGQTNAGRPWGLAATASLIATLLCFWFVVTALFQGRPILALTIRLSGTIAAIAAGLIFTSLHDYVIALAAPLGFVAIAGSLVGLAQTARWRFLSLGIFAITFAIADYLIWMLHLLRPWQPLIQKIAFVLIFFWVLVISLHGFFRPISAVGKTSDSEKPEEATAGTGV